MVFRLGQRAFAHENGPIKSPVGSGTPGYFATRGLELLSVHLHNVSFFRSRQ